MTQTKDIDDLAGWLDVYRTAELEKARAEEVIATARGKIEEALGDAEVGTVAGQPAVRWTHVHATRFDQKRAKAILGDEYASCLVDTASRRFTLVEAGE